MKLLLPLTLLALSAGAVPLLSAAAEPAPGTPRVLASAVQDSVADFRQKFRAALDARATNEMEKLVRTRKDDAIGAVMTVCVAISEGTNERLEAEIAGLRKTWKTVHRSAFADRQYEVFSLMSASFKRTRKQIMDAYLKTFPVFEKAREEKDQSTLAECADQLTSQAEGLEEVGDDYQASLAWYFVAQCYDEQYRGENADLYKAYAAWKKSATTREEAGLQDEVYTWAKDRAEQLEKAGFGDPSNAAAKAEAAEAAARAAAIPLTPTFQLVDELGAVRRPNYAIDELYQAWPYVFLQGDGSTAKIQVLPDSPDIRRDGAAKASVDVDGDGEGDVAIEVTGNITPVRFTTQDGREVAFLAVVGQQDDTYQGFRQNLAPDTSSMSIYFAPAGSVTVPLGEEVLQIYDDDLDGVYGSLGERIQTWQYLGVRQGDYEPIVDSVRIGNAKQAVPFSEMLQVGDQWYRFEQSEDGKELTALPLGEVATGTLRLKMKGPDVDYLIVKGVGGTLENAFFDIAQGSRGVEVPAGTYRLFAGRVSEGKRQQTQKALILPGKSMNNFVVKAGETTDVELGEPFGFEFEFEQDDESVTVKDSTVVVVGKAGETYQRLWNCVPQPEVLAREPGDRKGTELGSIRPSQTQEEMQVEGWQTAWFPMQRALEKGKLSGSDVEVQLYEKKNKLFGEIESEWKE